MVTSTGRDFTIAPERKRRKEIVQEKIKKSEEHVIAHSGQQMH